MIEIKVNAKIDERDPLTADVNIENRAESSITEILHESLGAIRSVLTTLKKHDERAWLMVVGAVAGECLKELDSRESEGKNLAEAMSKSILKKGVN